MAVERRIVVLAALVALYWAVVADEALRSAQHNGWLYYHGGDAGWYWSTAYTLTHLRVPPTFVGLGWSYLMIPFAAVGGPDMANGLPGVVVFDVVVLGAASVIGMYLIGMRLAGRLFGLWAAAVWVLGPVLATALYNAHNRPGLLTYFMPTGRGLNALSDYPSMVFAIFAAYFVLRAIESGMLLDGVLAGVLTGFVVEIKPSNGVFAVAAALGLMLARRARALAAAAAGIAPALVALTVWKHTGLGTIPLFAAGEVREAAGPVVGATLDASKYVTLDWNHLSRNIRFLQEVFWSVRILEFVLAAGTLALVWWARSKGAFVVAWFLLYAILKGAFLYANVEDASVYRFVEPAFPAWYLLAAGLVLLWPRGRRPRAPLPPLRAIPVAVTVAIVVVLALLPLAVASAARQIRPDTVAMDKAYGSVTPVVDDFRPRARVVKRGVVRIAWEPVTTPYASFAYKVFKGRNDGCTTQEQGAPMCSFGMDVLRSTQLTAYDDPHARGRLVYRVALVATWRVDPNAQDILLLSKPVTVDAP